MSITIPNAVIKISAAVVQVPFIIDLPHEGFNPSITRWRGKLLMAWRKGWFSARIWLGELSEDHRLLWGREVDFSHLWRLTEDDWLEDPRLVVAGNKVLVVFTYVRGQDICMAMATLGGDLRVEECQIMKSTVREWEKNWQLFECDKKLRVIYYPNPNTVGWRDGQQFKIPAADGARLDWEWGEARGGTPPIKIGEEYFSFFHSSIQKHYVAGFYAFEAKPPFRVTRWPSQPCMIAVKDAWHGGHAVVFPGGAIFENGRWLVAFGWQDSHCCLAWFDHSGLLATLNIRTLPPAPVTLPGRQIHHRVFSMVPPRKRPPSRPPTVKFVTGFVDLNRSETRPSGKNAAAYLEHARNLFSANIPLVVWLDCSAELVEQFREAASPYCNITVKEFKSHETETWRAVAGAGPLKLPKQRDVVKDSVDYLTVGLLKSELVARSIFEGDIPVHMMSGWIDCGISHLPGLGLRTAEQMEYVIRWQGDKIRIPGVLPPQPNGDFDLMAAFHRHLCGGIFSGPQILLLKFAGEVLHNLRAMLFRRELTWEVSVWTIVYNRHPDWFSWYQAEFDDRLLSCFPEEE